jgi:hypothetical protein
MAFLIIDVTRRKPKPSAGFELSNTANSRPQAYTTLTDRA